MCSPTHALGWVSLLLVAAPGWSEAPAAQNAKAPAVLVQSGHSGAVYAVAVSADGSIAVSGGEDQNLSIWDLQRGKEIGKIVKHTAPVRALDFCATGQLLISAGGDGVAAVWNLADKTMVASLATDAVFSSVAMSPDCGSAFLGDSHGLSLLWTFAAASRREPLPVPFAGAKVVAFSPSGKHLFAADDDGNLATFSAVTLKEERRSQDPGAHLIVGARFANGESEDVWLAVPTGILVWTPDADKIEALGGRPEPELLRPLAIWQWLAIAPGARLAIGATRGGEVRIVDLHSGETQHHMRLPDEPGIGNSGVSALASDPSGQRVVLGHSNGTVVSVKLGLQPSAAIIGRAPAEIETAELWPSPTRLVHTLRDGSAVALDILTGKSARLWSASDGGARWEPVSSSGASAVVSDAQGRLAVRNPFAGLSPQRLFLGSGPAGSHEASLTEICGDDDGRSLSQATADGGRLLVLACGGRLLLFRQVENGYRGERLEAAEGELPSSGGGAGAANVSACGASDDGKYLVVATSKEGVVLAVESQAVVARWHLTDFRRVSAVVFRPHSHEYLTVRDSLVLPDIPDVYDWGVVRLASDVTAGALATFRGDPRSIHAAAFVGDSMVVTGSEDGIVRAWDRTTGDQKWALRAHNGAVTAVALPNGGPIVVAAGLDGLVSFWDAEEGREVLRLSALGEGDWTAAAPAGWFDTSNIESPRQLAWVFDDDPFHALPPETFMRDFFEPRLVARVLAGERLAVQGGELATLSRVQPLVEIASVEWADPRQGVARVSVRVSAASGEFLRGGETVVDSTGVFDLRLFRDGQLVHVEPPAKPYRPGGGRALVGSVEERAQWQRDHEITLGPDGTWQQSFLVRVPRRPSDEDVTFTAYAFNKDRVKSTTAERGIALPVALTPRPGTAYLVSVGVNRTESSPSWDLNYAANDARRISQVVAGELDRTRQFGHVISVRLVSDDSQEKGELPASKAYLRAALDLLAGRAVEQARAEELGRAGLVERAQPEDLVILSISSHGYTDRGGTFHFVLHDIGRGRDHGVDDELDARTLSTDELSAWLQDVDAGELVLIVDACESESTIRSDGFKPGPMGSRGLGQLSYDKGMRVLAASKAGEAAFERGGRISDGLLSYALVHEGLELGLADWLPPERRVGIGEWLAYAEQAVPRLFQEGDAKGSVHSRGEPDGVRHAFHGARATPPRYQQPVLFDFRKGERESFVRLPDPGGPALRPRHGAALVGRQRR